MDAIGRHAVVVGASMGGLAFARVLADYYEQVTVVDRDTLSAGAVHRGGVPQARHAHGLLTRGQNALEELFPGLSDDVVRRGGSVIDLQADSLWYTEGHPQARGTTGLVGLLASRPLLEAAVRDRVSALPNVRLLEGYSATGLTADAGRTRITGVDVARYGGGGEHVLVCDLAVDASGRGSRSPEWLEALGYEGPPVDEIRSGVRYATRVYRRRPQDAGGASAVLVSASPELARTGAMIAIEDDRWMVTLGGYGDQRPPVDGAGFLAYAASLPGTELHAVVRDGEPLDDPVAFHYPRSVRRRYERLRAFPAGYLVAADALCSFNPIYGQGLTAAALEALALRDCLRDGSRRLPQRFFAAAANIVEVPWRMVLAADLRFPHVPGRRTLGMRLANGYLLRLQRAARRDPLVGLAFVRVANLIDPPQRLLSPAVVWRVLRGNLPRLAGRRPVGLELAAGKRHAVHLVGPVGQPQDARL